MDYIGRSYFKRKKLHLTAQLVDVKTFNLDDLPQA